MSNLKSNWDSIIGRSGKQQLKPRAWNYNPDNAERGRGGLSKTQRQHRNIEESQDMIAAARIQPRVKIALVKKSTGAKYKVNSKHVITGMQGVREFIKSIGFGGYRMAGSDKTVMC